MKVYNSISQFNRATSLSSCCAIVLLLSGLSGCGGGDEGGESTIAMPPSVSPVGQVSAVDGFGVVRPGVSTRLDLSAFVRGPNATLVTMSSEQADCTVSNLSGLSANITNESGLCEYTYTVSNQNSDASAAINVLASSKSSPVLPPLSQTIFVGAGDATYDLQALLGSDWPSGYTLDSASLEVQGGSVQGSVTANGNVLTYTPPATPDWNRIVFILKNPAKPGEDSLGTLYVTVSDSVNQAPTIGLPKYDYKAQTGTSVVTHQGVTLDLATLPNLNIADPEGQEWQLAEVQSYSASVVPVDPSSVTNKQFTFTAGAIGDHIVSYIVGDHEGGFTTGLINVGVGPDERAKTWTNITIADLTFWATPLYSEVVGKGAISEGVWDSGVSNTVGAVTGAGASTYCGSVGGNLATQDQLDILRSTSAADVERNKYPTGRGYLFNNGAGGNSIYDLVTGAITAYTPGASANQYVICVSSAGLSYSPFINNSAETLPYTSNAMVVHDQSYTGWTPVGIVTSAEEITNIQTEDYTGNANVAAYVVPTGCVSGTCTLHIDSNSENHGSVGYFKPGNFAVRLTSANGNQMVIKPMTLLVDAKLVGSRIEENNNPADGSSANTVITTFVRKDGSPASSGFKLNYSAPSGVSITPASGSIVIPNAAGEVALSLTSTTAGDYSISFSDDAVSEGLLGNAGSQTVTFSPGPPPPPSQIITVPGIATFHFPAAGKFQFSGSNTASQYCGRLTTGGKRWKVPRLEHLQGLYNAYPNGRIVTDLGWPTDDFYWSTTDNGYGYSYYVSLNNGYYSFNQNYDYHYVACIEW